MGTTITEICNSALAKLGANRILSIDDDTPEGRACQEQYEKIKKSVLRGHPWNFAIKRAQVAALVEEPAFEFDKYYALPADCLRVLNIEGEQQFPWKVEGRRIVTDNPECNLKYVANIDEGLFDDNFSEALAYQLAVDLCMPITQSANLKESLERKALLAIREARSFDAQESVGDRVYADTWLTARY